MQINSEPDYVLGNEETVNIMEKQPALPIFSEEACHFLENMSMLLMESAEAKLYPDVVTFAFWCRKASVKQMAKGYMDEGRRLGRGIVFHIAPSNVAVNFAYSMAASLLAGNACVVRLPSKEFPQVRILCAAMRNSLEKVPQMKPYLVLIKYKHEKEITDRFSKMCNLRVIWGGDRTIEEIRTSPIKPRANEITFSDRYSMAIIDGESYLGAEDKMRIANDFYNDTYLTDQNACTSPRIIVWIGKCTEKARKIFWEQLWEVITHKHYDLQPVQAIDKFTQLCLLGAKKETRWKHGKDNLILRAEVQTLDEDITDLLGNSGFFVEYIADDVKEILAVCGLRCQTLSYHGVPKKTLTDMICMYRPRGIDRIVPIGRTMDFSIVWDGHDLVREMSRIVAED